jgi:uncharacterized pyridoxamine 5'-phosphate oxidase family protein
MEYTDIEPYFDGVPLIYLATSTEFQPHVRAMALIHYDHKLWCCSPGSRPKVQQIRTNNKIEFCLLIQKNKQYHNIRGTGKAIEIIDFETRMVLSQQIPFFLAYWTTPDDPEFILYRLDIDQIEYHPPGGKKYFILDMKKNHSQEILKNFRRNQNED